LKRTAIIAVALTGASGMPYGLRLVESLLRAKARVVLLYSQAAHVVAKHECVLDQLGIAHDLMRRWGENLQQSHGR
jgi:3-polyprenyl-4-hydroxybenzoate decarboxylase